MQYLGSSKKTKELQMCQCKHLAPARLPILDLVTRLVTHSIRFISSLAIFLFIGPLF